MTFEGDIGQQAAQENYLPTKRKKQGEPDNVFSLRPGERFQTRIQWGGTQQNPVAPLEEMEFGVQGGQGGQDLHDKKLKSRELYRQKTLNISSLGQSLALCTCGSKLLEGRKEQARSGQSFAYRAENKLWFHQPVWKPEAVGRSRG